MYLGLYCIYH